jgi:hypothetical protein
LKREEAIHFMFGNLTLKRFVEIRALTLEIRDHEDGIARSNSLGNNESSG